MLRITKTVRTIGMTTPLSVTASHTAAVRLSRASSTSAYNKYSDELEAKGMSVASHVTTSKSAEACPFVSQDEILLATSKRESSARTYNRRFPISIAKADGCLLFDSEGNRFVDALACAGTLALGHNHPVVTEAITSFVSSGQPLQTLDLASPVKHEFVNEVFDSFPSAFADDAKIQFCGPTGTDAVEAAIKLAKRATGRTNIIAFHGGYHGHSNGSLALMGNLGAKENVPNLMPGSHFLPYPYSYRCPFGLGGDEGTAMTNTYIESVLSDVESGIVKPAAIILEAVQGEGGVIPAPIPFLRRLRELCTEHDIPLIVDEIQSGWGRTGHMFAHEIAGISPDIVTLSKAVGGGLPMAVVMYNKKLDTWGPGEHAGTFRGNQMAMATGTAAIRYIKSEGLVDEANRKGNALQKSLRDIQSSTRCIGEVRGRGLMIGVEIVDKTKTANKIGSFPAHGAMAAQIQMECFRRGLIIEKGGRHGAVIRFLPPLIASDSILSEVVSIFGEAVIASEKKLLD